MPRILSKGLSLPETVQQGSGLKPEPPILTDGNTVAWYDFKKSDTITKDGSNFVSRWKDRLLSGRDLVQAVGTNQPLLTADGITFDGIDNFLKTATFTLIQPEQVYICFRADTHTVNKSIMSGFNSNDPQVYLRSLNRVGLYTSGYALSGTELNVGEFNVVRFLVNGAATYIKVNAAVAVTGYSSAANMSGITLGKQGAVTDYSNITVKELIVRKIADTTTNSDAIYNYFKTKYAL